MSLPREQIEAAVVSMITTVLDAAIEDLNRAGLRADVRPVRRDKQALYSSELAVWFWAKQGAVVKDAIEFFIYKDGEAVMEIAEIERWFGESLADVIKKA